MFQEVISLETESVVVTQTMIDVDIDDVKIKEKTLLKETTDPIYYKLLRKYFHKWKDNIKHINVMHLSQTQRTKINQFITTLKNHHKVLHTTTDLKQYKSSKILKPNENFKHRDKVKNDIIDLQREKLKEQNIIIDELKLGIIREDILKSVESRKNYIREIFANCSEKILCEAPLIKPVEEREKIMVNAQRAPKIAQKLQRRAIEREKYRETILERKRIKDEEHKKLLNEMIEKKKNLEEEERKKQLEILNEQRKQELKLQKIRQQKKQQAALRHLMAVNFHNKVLMKQCFKKLLNFYYKSKEDESLATTIFVYKEKLKIFKLWLGHVESKYSTKNNIADAHFRYKVLKQSMNKWKEFKQDCVRSWQVAQDFFDLKLASNTFIHWHRHTCKEIMIEYKKNQLATNHYQRCLLFRYFYRWISLPAVIQLEKCKEKTKRKWREKVWEILPDFRPLEHL